MVIKDRFSKVIKTVGDGTANLAKAVGDGAVKVAQKSEKMAKISKLNLSISSRRKKIEENCNELGKMLYEKFIQGETIFPDLIDLCLNITEEKNTILSLQKEIEELKVNDGEEQTIVSETIDGEEQTIVSETIDEEKE